MVITQHSQPISIFVLQEKCDTLVTLSQDVEQQMQIALGGKKITRVFRVRPKRKANISCILKQHRTLWLCASHAVS